MFIRREPGYVWPTPQDAAAHGHCPNCEAMRQDLESARTGCSAYRDAMEEAKREATQLREVLARIAAIRLDGEPDELGEDVSMDIGDAFRALYQVVTDAREVTR